MDSIKNLAVSSLHLNKKNPRCLGEAEDEKEALYRNIHVNPDEFLETLESLYRSGYVSGKGIITAVQEGDKLLVMDGNRRISALKLLLGQVKMDKKMQECLNNSAVKLIESVTKEWKKENRIVPCTVVLLDRSYEIMESNHTSSAKASTQEWDNIQRARFLRDYRGKTNQFLDLVEKFLTSDFLKDKANSGGLNHKKYGACDLVKFERVFPLTLFTEVAMPRYVEAAQLDVLQFIKLYPEYLTDDERLSFEEYVLDVGLGNITTEIARGYNSQNLSQSKYKVCPVILSDKKIRSEVNQETTKTKEPATADTVSDNTLKVQRKQRVRKMHPDLEAKNIVLEWGELGHAQGKQKIRQLAGEINKLYFDEHPHAVAFLLRCFVELSTRCFCEREGIPMAKYKSNKNGVVDFQLSNLLKDLPNIITADWAKDKGIPADKVREFDSGIRVMNDCKQMGSVADLNDAMHRDSYQPDVVSLRRLCGNINVLMCLFLAKY